MQKSNFILCGLFLCPLSLGRPETSPRRCFQTRWIDWHLFQEYFFGVQKSTFSSVGVRAILPKMAKFWKIFKFAIFTRLSPYGLQGVENITGESFLSTNNALRKFFSFDPKVQKSNFILCGLFLCPLSLGRPETSPQRCFQTRWIDWHLFQEYFFGVQKSTFSSVGVRAILPKMAKFWKIFKFAIFTRLSPYGLQGVENITGESFLSTNNALRKFFSFDPKVQKSNFILCGLFLCPLSLGRPETSPRRCFQTRWIDWHLFQEYFFGVQKSTFSSVGVRAILPKMAKFWKIFKFAIFTRLSPYGLQGVENITGESFLSTNNALRKFFSFDPKVQKSNFILCGLFLCPLSLGRPETSPRRCFQTRWIDWHLFQEYFFGVQKSTFSSVGVRAILPKMAKFWKIFKFAIFTRLSPYGLQGVENITGESFLSTNNALRKFFSFDPKVQKSNFILCGLFLCPLSLGRPETSPRRCFQTRWIDWHLFQEYFFGVQKSTFSSVGVRAILPKMAKFWKIFKFAIFTRLSPYGLQGVENITGESFLSTNNALRKFFSFDPKVQKSNFILCGLFLCPLSLGRPETSPRRCFQTRWIDWHLFQEYFFGVQKSTFSSVGVRAILPKMAKFWKIFKFAIFTRLSPYGLQGVENITGESFLSTNNALRKFFSFDPKVQKSNFILCGLFLCPLSLGRPETSPRRCFQTRWIDWHLFQEYFFGVQKSTFSSVGVRAILPKMAKFWKIFKFAIFTRLSPYGLQGVENITGESFLSTNNALRKFFSFDPKVQKSNFILCGLFLCPLSLGRPETSPRRCFQTRWIDWHLFQEYFFGVQKSTFSSVGVRAILPKMAKFWKIFKFAIFTRLSPYGLQGVENITGESFLSTNNALRKFFSFDPKVQKSNFILCGLFLCPLSLGRPETSPRRCFQTRWIDWHLFQEYFFGVQKSTFSSVGVRAILPKMAKFWKIFKFAIFTRLSPYGLQGVENITGESFLSTNNALRKFFSFDPKVQKSNFILCGLFLCPLSLGRPETSPRRCFQTRWIDWHLFQEYFFGVQKSTFSSVGVRAILPKMAKFWKIFKFAIFTRLSPYGLQGVENITGESFLSTNNALRKFFSFDPKVQKSNFILCGLFLCPLSLGRPETSPRRCFQTRWIDWHLFQEYFFGVQKSTFSSVGVRAILPKMAKFWKIFKFAIFTRLSPYGLQGVENITGESFLSTNNALRKFFSFDPKVQKSNFILCGLFLCPLSLGRPETSPRRCFQTRWIDWHLFQEYFFGVQKSTFSSVGVRAILPKMAKFWKIFKFAIFTRLSPYGLQGVENITGESFLSTNNALRKFFSFDPKVQKSNFILCGLFLCPLSLGRPETSPRRCFQTRWIDWHLFQEYFFGVQKSTFSSVGVRAILPKMAKFWKIFKFAIFTRLSPYGL